MQLPGGKGWKTGLQLVRAARSKEGVQLHLLDVRMPKDIQEPLRAANDQFTPWEPSPKQLAALSREWASLPPATDKDVRRGDAAALPRPARPPGRLKLPRASHRPPARTRGHERQHRAFMPHLR